MRFLSAVATLLLLSSFTTEGYLRQGQGRKLHVQAGRQQQLGKQRLQPVAVTASAAQASSAVTSSAIKAVLKLIGTCGIGVYAGKQGILDKTALSVLSKLVFNIFQPCLLFCNVASTVASAKKNAAVWILPFAAALQIFIGYLVGKVVTTIIYGNKASTEEKRQTLTCTTFSNSGPLPFVFVDALLRTHPDPTMVGRANAYISLYLLGWSPLFWIVAPAILSDPSSTDGKSPEDKRKELITRIFSPPVVGSLMGLLVGSVPFTRQILISPAGALNWFFSAMSTLGAAYLPAVLLVLAGSLTPARDAAEEAAEQAKSPAVRNAESRAFFTQISSIYAARYALMPLVGFFLVATIRRFAPSIDRIFGADPLLVFILLLEACMPSAQNSTVILQLQNKKTAAARMARVLMLVYILGIPALSYWLVRVLSATSLL